MIRFVAFVFSGLWSGVAGLLYLYYHQFVSPHAVALTASAEALLMVISGGTGTLLGPIAGAALVVVMKNVASAYIERWNFVLGAIFVVIVVFMPEGLCPARRVSLAGRRRVATAVAAGRSRAPRRRPGDESRSPCAASRSRSAGCRVTVRGEPRRRAGRAPAHHRARTAPARPRCST